MGSFLNIPCHCMCWRCPGGDVGDLSPKMSLQFPVSVEMGQNNRQCMKMSMSFCPHLELQSLHIYRNESCREKLNTRFLSDATFFTKSYCFLDN
jgi:hypothetical protein